MNDLVEPKDAATPTPAEVEPTSAAAAPEQQSSGIDQKLLQVPAIQAVLAGSPAAISSPLKDWKKNPVNKLIAENKDELMGAGIGFYKSLSGDTGVMFNSMHLHPEELKAADKAGQLLKVAPPASVVDQQISKSGADHPILNAQVPAGLKGAPVPQPPTSAQTVLPAPVKQQGSAAAKKQLTARLLNLQSGAPTSGPTPGQGRLLNSILKPVV